jgi:glutamate dehydrogenase
VRVRRGEAAACAAARDVVDIVTADMPFLVDSIRMELTRHDVTTQLVVHPQFLVSRNVAGELREVIGLVDGERPPQGEIAESWTHVEIGRLADGEAAKLERDLERVLGDVRVAVEDWHRIQARAVQLAEHLAMSAEGSPSESDESPAEVEALLRWLADRHFTFLGYREYAASPAPGSASCGMTGLARSRSPRCPLRCGPGPRTRSC